MGKVWSGLGQGPGGPGETPGAAGAGPDSAGLPEPEAARSAGAGAGAAEQRANFTRRLRIRAANAAGVAPEDWRDWGDRLGGGLPEELLAKVAGKVVAQTEAGWAAQLKKWGYREELIQEEMAKREREGNCLFVVARVCKEWRKAQLKVGGRLRTRVGSDVVAPGSVALAKWALAEGCPRDNGDDRDQEDLFTMAHDAAHHGHRELVQWLVREQGFAMDEMGFRG